LIAEIDAFGPLDSQGIEITTISHGVFLRRVPVFTVFIACAFGHLFLHTVMLMW
jgi:hypothetical protein